MRSLARSSALGIGQAALQAIAEQQQAVQAPRFEVDPVWPKPLPNHWVMGMTRSASASTPAITSTSCTAATRSIRRREGGLGTDPPISECCKPAPPVLEFDPDGNLVRAWGGPGEGYDWPQSNHGITIDSKDNVWIGGNGAADSHILKFTRDGKFLMQIGTPSKGSRANSNSIEHFGRVAKIAFDDAANEAYIADGYGNRRVAVVDMNTGAIKRFWGAYGNKPDDTNPRRLQSGCAADPAVPHPSALRRAQRMMGWSTCAIAPTTASRSSARTARS